MATYATALEQKKKLLENEQLLSSVQSKAEFTVDRITSALRKHGYTGDNWRSFGNFLNLPEYTLTEIEGYRSKGVDALSECLKRWLLRGQVDRLKVWPDITDALRAISETVVADGIEQDRCQAVSILQRHKDSLIYPLQDYFSLLRLAKLLKEEEVISEADLYAVRFSQVLLSQRAENLLAAVECTVQVNYSDLEIFGSALLNVVGSIPVTESLLKECDIAFTNEADFDCTSFNLSASMKKDLITCKTSNPKFSEMKKKLVHTFINLCKASTRSNVSFACLLQQMKDRFSHLQPQLASCHTIDDILEFALQRCTLLDISALDIVANLLNLEVTTVQKYKADIQWFHRAVTLRMCFKETFQVVKRPLLLQSETATLTIDINPDTNLHEMLKNVVIAVFEELSEHVKILRIRESVSVLYTFPVNLKEALVIKARKNFSEVKNTVLSIGLWDEQKEMIKCGPSYVLDSINRMSPQIKDILTRKSLETTFVGNMKMLDNTYRETNYDNIMRHFFHDLMFKSQLFQEQCQLFIHALEKTDREIECFAEYFTEHWGLQDSSEDDALQYVVHDEQESESFKPQQIVLGMEQIYPSDTTYLETAFTSLENPPEADMPIAKLAIVNIGRLKELVLDDDNGTVPVNLVAVATDGLPVCGKTTAMTRMISNVLSSSDAQKGEMNDRCLSTYHLCVLGGSYPYPIKKKFKWTLKSKRYSITYFMLHVLIRMAVLGHIDPLKLEFQPLEGSAFSPKSLHHGHFQWILKKMCRLHSRIKTGKLNIGYFQTDATLVTAVDVGFNKALHDLLPIVASVCTRLVRLTCFSLDRDTDKMHFPPEIGEKHTNTEVMQSRSRLAYLLHHAAAGYVPNKHRDHRTLMVGITESNDKSEADSQLQKAKCIIMDAAKKLNIEQVFNENWLYVNADDKKSLNDAREALEHIILRNPSFQRNVPLKWFFLRTLIPTLCDSEGKSHVIMTKTEIEELARTLEMYKDDVTKFLTAFTEFASLIYIPDLEREHVIVDLHGFTNLLDKLYNDDTITRYGIFTSNIATKHFGSLLVDKALKIMIAYNLVAEVPAGCVDVPDDFPISRSELLYFLPSARVSNTTNGKNNNSVHIVVESTHVPINFQVTIAHFILKKVSNAFLVACKSYNVARFRLQHGKTKTTADIYIEVVYRGDTAELRLCNDDADSLLSPFAINACTEFLNACIDALIDEVHTRRGLKFSIGMLCFSENKTYHHFLPGASKWEADFCQICKDQYKKDELDITQTKCVKRWCWLNAAKKCNSKGLSSDVAYQYEHSFIDAEFVAFTATALSGSSSLKKEPANKERLLSALGVTDESLQEYENGPLWQYYMMCILMWQKATPSLCRTKENLRKIVNELKLDITI